MQDFIDAVVFGFKGILNFKRMRLALAIGMVISIVWVFLGMFFWDGIVSFAALFLDLIPFSMIRSNGAWMLSTFLWVQLVLITFALIFAFFGGFIINSVSREKYGSFSILVAMGSALFWSVVWFFEGDYIYKEALQLLTWLPFETIEKTLSYLIGFYFIYNLIILSIIFISSITSQSFLYSAAKHKFPYDDFLDDNEERTIAFTLKDTGIFIGVSIIAFPLLFIPILNFFIQVGLWVWLIKDTASFDAASLVYKDVNKTVLKEHKKAIYGFSLLGSLFNFIPVFNIVGPYFTELSMFYYFKEQQNS